MIERQNHHLVAGVRELYQRLQNNDGWIGPQPGDLDDGRPATHQILEALGIQSMDETPRSWSYSPRGCAYRFSCFVISSWSGYRCTPSSTGICTFDGHIAPASQITAFCSHASPNLSPSVTKTGVFTGDGNHFPPLMPAVKANMNLTFGSNCGTSADMVIQNMLENYVMTILQNLVPATEKRPTGAEAKFLAFSHLPRPVSC